jgi:hypothetical protein
MVRAWSRRYARKSAQPAADLGTDLLEQQPLERAVHVLVAVGRPEVSGGVPLPQCGEPAEELGVVGVGEEPGAVQGVGVGA